LFLFQIVPGAENAVAIELISTHIRRQLKERSNHFREKMATPRISGKQLGLTNIDDLHLTILPQTPQLKVAHLLSFSLIKTEKQPGHLHHSAGQDDQSAGFYLLYRPPRNILSGKGHGTLALQTYGGLDTGRSGVTWQSVGRICKLILHLAILPSLLTPYIVHMRRVNTTIVRDKGPFICSCTPAHGLFRGGPLERGLERVISDVLMGSLLVQSDSKTREPLLLQVMLPICIRERHKAKDTWVFLLDAQVLYHLIGLTNSWWYSIRQIGTAAAAFMAIRVLLDHGVLQDHIIFVTFLVARGGGISVLRRAFPEVKIVTGAVDGDMREAWVDVTEGDGYFAHEVQRCWIMEPGMGQIGGSLLIKAISLLIVASIGDRYYL
jgi:uracil phosphoribosyltransferase